MDEEIAHQSELLAKYKANLRTTELQAAQYGIDVPVKLQNDIFYYRECIQEISAIIEEHSAAYRKRSEFQTTCLVRIYNEILHNSKEYLKVKSFADLPEDIPPSEENVHVSYILRTVMQPDFPVFQNIEWTQVYRVVTDILDVEDLEWVAATYSLIRETENARNDIIRTPANKSNVLSAYQWYVKIIKRMDIYIDIAKDTLSDTLSTKGIDTRKY
jgi:hypothetical protein